ncbi:hypothetical protein ACROYT_G024667 [Oculina patagonica]
MTAFLSIVVKYMANSVLFRLPSDRHFFEGLSEHGNSKTVYDRIDDRIGEIKNVKNVNKRRRNTLGTQVMDKIANGTWEKTDKRHSYHNKQSPGEFCILFSTSDVGTNLLWNYGYSKHGQLTEPNKYICCSQVYKKKGRSLQSVTVLPKHEYGEDVANNNDQRFNDGDIGDPNSSCIRHGTEDVGTR